MPMLSPELSLQTHIIQKKIEMFISKKPLANPQTFYLPTNSPCKLSTLHKKQMSTKLSTKEKNLTFGVIVFP
jgi:hypothetical protein